MPLRTRNTIQAVETAQETQQNRQNEANQINTQKQNTIKYYINKQEQDQNSQKVIHVSGSKGKGSTCMYAESILRKYGYNTGQYTSPHLITQKERIQINGKQIQDSIFCENFWRVWDTVWSNRTPTIPIPGYFSFLTLVALQTFISEKLDVIQQEVGIGGKLDSTNVIPNPLVCGVTHLGLEHTNILGTTITSIAKEKAGIFKSSAYLCTQEQYEHPESIQVLIDTANSLNQPLYIVEPLDINTNKWLHLEDCLYQRRNISLAVLLVHMFFNSQNIIVNKYINDDDNTNIYKDAIKVNIIKDKYCKYKQTYPQTHEMIDAISNTKIYGRYHIQNNINNISNIHYYLDGAHTQESQKLCLEWFQKMSTTKTKDNKSYILVFNCARTKEPYKQQKSIQDTCIIENNISRFSTIYLCPFDKDKIYNGSQNYIYHTDIWLKENYQKNNFIPTLYKYINDYKDIKDNIDNDNIIDGLGFINDISWQHTLSGIQKTLIEFQKIDKNCSNHDTNIQIYTMPNVQNTLHTLESIAKNNPDTQYHILVTGSLYLVGDVLKKVSKVVST